MGLGQVPALPLATLMQSWRWQPKDDDEIEEDVGGHVAQLSDLDVLRVESSDIQENLFPWLVVIPGMMHILHNLSEHFMEKLDCWKRISASLAPVSRVLHSWDNLRRMKRTCFASCEAAFDIAFTARVPMLVSWRWGSIQSTMTALLSVEQCLQFHWSGSQKAQLIAWLAQQCRISDRAICLI